MTQRDVPADAVELVATAWARAFGHSDFGLDQTFFAAGGTSLIIQRIAAELREQGYPVRAATIFRHNTVRSLAAVLAALPRPVATPTRASVTDHDPGGEPPQVAVPSGEATWPTSDIVRYHLGELRRSGGVDLESAEDTSMLVELSGPLDAAALRLAGVAVVRRHAALRCRFDLDAPERMVECSVDDLPGAAEVVQVVDFGPGTAAAERAREAAEGFLRRGFDPAHPPLLRAMLARAGELSYLGITVSHLVADAASMAIIFFDLADACRAFAAGDAPEPAWLAPGFSYGQVVVADRERLAAVGDARRAYWRTAHGVPPRGPEFDLPRVPAPPRPGGGPGVRIQVPVSAATLRQLREVWRSSGVSVEVNLLTAFAAALHSVTGAEQVPIKRSTAMRGSRSLDGVVGWLADWNVVFIRSAAAFASTPLRELSLRTRQALLDAEDNYIPFHTLFPGLAHEEPNVEFTYWTRPTVARQGLPGVGMTMLDRGFESEVTTGCECVVDDEGDRLRITLAVVRDQYPESTCAELAAAMATALRYLAEEGDRTPADLVGPLAAGAR